ncbi:C5a anaphylatoxin chemotactic receptor 1 [Elgaria multicarinata webbii]|uniref:C5a anaphylatoxin chemotactic receptor 1 n=1 Tax=Elgaria multicarinata webbii TaxID=159646 RepID=UPI002FCD5E5C
MDFAPNVDDNFDYTDYNFTSVTQDLNSTSMSTAQAGLSPVAWVALAVYAVVFLLGVLGNGAVIWVVAFQMRHTVNTIWFLNLSVADLLCCLSLPFLAESLANGYSWRLGDFACKLLPSLNILNMFASVLLLTLISVDRWALVVKPVWCQNHRSACLAWALCAVAWGSALLLTLPSFLTRETKSSFPNQMTCGTNYAILGEDHHKAEVSVAVMRLLFGFLIPFVVISLCYGLLLLRVHRSRFMRSKKTLKVVLVVVVSFFICWAPFHAFALIFANELPSSALYQSVHDADPLVVALAYINSCINPIIYVIAGQDFQAKVQHSLKNLLRNVLSEESTRAHSLAEGHTQAICTTTEDRSTSTTL